MSSNFYSDTDDDSRTIQSMQSMQSTPTTNRRKRTANVVNRSNRSHTSYFFRIDESNSDIVYCKICERNLVGQQKPYPYTRKGGNTSNMIAHLRDKHGIIKDNYTEYLNENKEVQ